VNASASALPRDVEVRSKIRNVRAFSRFARVVCSALFAFGLVGSVGVLIVGGLGVISPPPDGAAFTFEQRMWGIPIAAAVLGTWLAIVFQLYRLFGSLAAGSIYTPENVRRVRNVGLLWLLLAALGFAIPLAAHALTALGITVPLKSAFLFPGSAGLGSLAAAGVVVLASWIMDVGLYEKDHADALRRDADLVI
jgi:hypothetical protein